MGGEWEENGRRVRGVGGEWEENGRRMGGEWGENGRRMGGEWEENGRRMGGEWEENGRRMGGEWEEKGRRKEGRKEGRRRINIFVSLSMYPLVLNPVVVPKTAYSFFCPLFALENQVQFKVRGRNCW
jgi:hypothetical protein